MLKNIFRTKLFNILTCYLPISFLSVITIPFDLLFAKLVGIILGQNFSIKKNFFDLYFFGEYELNAFNICFFLIFLGITPVIIRALLAYKTLDISKDISTKLFQNIYKRLIHEDGEIINSIGDKKALGIITNHLNSFSNLFITPIAQAFNSLIVALFFIVISILIEPKASLLILSSTFSFVLVLLITTKNFRKNISKKLGVYRTTQIGLVSSALEEYELLKYAEEDNYMTLKTFSEDYKLREAIKNSLFLSQAIRFLIELSLPISFIFITFEFLNEGKTDYLFISLILILKSVPFVQQAVTCISTAQLNQKSYSAVKELIKTPVRRRLRYRNINLEKVSEILFKEITIPEFKLTYPKNIIKINSINVIKGISGSGKSTYLKALAGNFKFINVFFSTRNFNNGQSKFLKLNLLNNLIIYQNQNYKLSPITVLENLKLLNKDVDLNKLKDMMRLFDIFQTSNLTNDQLLNLDLAENPDYLSGGEIQRLCLVRDFLSPFPIVLLDEPTSALDSSTTKKVVKTLKLLSNSRTIVISTHEAEFNKVASNIFEIKCQI